MGSSRRIAVLCWTLLGLLVPSLASAQEKAPADSKPAPVFDSTSAEPVLLRYRMKTGQVLKLSLVMDSEAKVQLGSERITVNQTMQMDAKGAVTAVDGEGNISMVVKLTHMSMKTSGGPTNIEFDTDKANDNPNFKAVLAMINVGIPCRVSPEGKMLETDLEPLRLAVRRADNGALGKALDDSAQQMFDGTFVQLSPTPVKAGDTYKAGTIISDKMKVNMSYRIRSVSGDKSKAILEPVPVLEMAPEVFPPELHAKLKSQSVSGWMLYDVQNGCPGDCAINMRMVVDIDAMGQAGTIDVNANTTVTMRLQ